MRPLAVILRSAALTVLCLAALALPAHRAFAQITGPPQSNQDRVPYSGGGVTTLLPGGGQHIQFGNGAPVARPVGGPSDSEFSATVEFETWKNDIASGVFRGNRQTILAGYTKSQGNNEVGVILPFEFLDISGVKRASKFDDTEVTFRRYSYDETDPTSSTTVYGVKVMLPTGSLRDGIGLGKWGIGPTVTVSKPMGKSLYYVGGNYTILQKKASDFLKDTYFVWLGGITQLQPKTSVQYELTKFRSANGDGRDNFRVLVGPRFAVSPTAGVQVNIKQELQAGSKDTTVSVGYSNRI